MRRTLLAVICLCFIALTAQAVPARRGTFTHRQSDDTELTLQLVGDEHLHYYVNVATGERMLRQANGDFYVAEESVINERKTAAQARRQASNARRTNRLKAKKKVGEVNNSITGSKKGLVILVNFSDTEMKAGHTKSVFENQFNAETYTDNGHIGSVHKYFYDQSYGLFDLTFDVVGPVPVSKAMSYYGANDSDDNDEHPAEMVIEALTLADSQVNYADYDWDGDGEVDQVYVIYAGYGEAYSGADENTIWPHEWTLSSANYYGDGTGAQTLDGVKIDTYACSSELTGISGSTLNGIGTACHEFSHCLGFPDFYDTDYSGAFGMSAWDIMDSGSYNGPNYYGEVPSGYTSYERWMAGWLTPTELSAAATITNMKPLSDEPEAYVIYNANNQNEYYLLENRQNESWFNYVEDYTTPHGLLVIHVDYDATAWEGNTPNDDEDHQRMSIIAAGNTYGTKTYSNGSYYWNTTEAQYKGMLFGGSSTVTTLDNDSHTSYGGQLFNKNTDGTYNMNHELTEISENTSTGTISFLFDGGEVIDDGSRYTVTFDAGTGSCATTSWTQTEFRESITLPTATSPNDDYQFAGWATESVSETTTRPTLYSAGSSYRPTANVTLFAVYAYSESGSTSSDYELVTSSLDDWSGEYLIVYTSGSVAMDGSLSTLDADGNNFSVTITNNKIASDETTDAKNFTIEATTSGYSIQSASGIYIGASSNSNTITTNSSPLNNTISYNGGNIDIKGTGGAYLRYNNSASRFRYYKSSSYTGQKAIQLYRKAGGSVTYNSEPGGSSLVTPTLTFALSGDQSVVVGQTLTNAATVTGSTAPVTYASSNETVATVDANGVVTTLTVGSATITASVEAVSGISRAAQASYLLTVTVDESIRHTVTLNPGNGTCSTPSLTETGYQSGVELPSATSTTNGWTFAGWATESVSETTTAPTLYAAGSTFVPETDITLFAVYSVTTEGDGSNGNYVLVSSEPSDWSGEYLIVTPDMELAMDGSLSTLDATGNNFEVTISDNTIEATTDIDARNFTIAAVSGGYTIQSASGLYIGNNSETNGLKTDDEYVNTLTLHEGDSIDIVSAGTYLRYNMESTQDRFRYYKSSTYQRQKSIQLYRKGGGSTTTYSSNPTEAVDLPTYTVTLNPGRGTCDYESLTEENHKSGVTLPTATAKASGWTFAGWATAEVDETTEAPTLYAAGTLYNPTADITLYAVYSQTTEEQIGESGDYVLVTEEQTDWSGQYLIVYADGSLAFDGSLETLDATNNYFEVTISNNTIAATTDIDARNFTIAALDEGYSIKSASGYYIGKGGDTNGLLQNASTQYQNTLSYDTSNECTDITGTVSTHLRFNATSNQMRFRYLKSSTYQSYGAIQLFRKSSTASTTSVTTYDSTPGQVTIKSLAELIDDLLNNSGTTHRFSDIDRMLDEILEK